MSFPPLQDVDQASGEDLNPTKTRTLRGSDDPHPELEARNPDRPVTLPLAEVPQQDGIAPCQRTFKRVSSPERWEIKQMMAANVIDKSQLPDFDELTGLLPRDDDSGGSRCRGNRSNRGNVRQSPVRYFDAIIVLCVHFLFLHFSGFEISNIVVY